MTLSASFDNPKVLSPEMIVLLPASRDRLGVLHPF